MENKPTAIDLFAGCGGLSLGLVRAGFDVRAAIEIDAAAAETYGANHKKTCVIQGDIKEISALETLDLAGLGVGGLDLLAGCPPCQGFSRIKRLNRTNVDDVRNNLIYDFYRFAKELKPKMILMENVPGLAKDKRFKKVIKGLEDLGYKCVWGVLNAADYGVPQRRKRLIMMASRVGSVTLPAAQRSKKTVRTAFEKITKKDDSLHGLCLKNSQRIKDLIRNIPSDGGSRSSLRKNQQLDCHKKFNGFKDVYGRMSWDDVSPTLTGGCFNPSKGRYLHPLKNRAITMREAALLQSFPVGYFFPHKRGLITVARLIGDAVPPAFAAKQALQLSKNLKKIALKK